MEKPLSEENPWIQYRPNYLHPLDVEIVKNLNEKIRKAEHRMRGDIPPAPFKGKVLEAKVIVLMKNPGFDERENEEGFYNKFGYLFIEQARMNYSVLDSPLFYNDAYKKVSDYWYKRFKGLCSALDKQGVDGEHVVANNVATINFYPYHSIDFPVMKFEEFILPTQRFSFSLVEKAIKRNALIVLVRGEKLWFENVEGLKNYPHIIRLNSDQNSYITERNCGGAENWQRLVNALTE